MGYYYNTCWSGWYIRLVRLKLRLKAKACFQPSTFALALAFGLTDQRALHGHGITFADEVREPTVQVSDYA